MWGWWMRESRYCSYFVAIAAATAAGLRWGQRARSCRYTRYHSNNVELPSDDLTCGGRWGSSITKYLFDKRCGIVIIVGDIVVLLSDWTDLSPGRVPVSEIRMLVRKKTNIFEREFFFTLFIERLRDVTLLTLVLVENFWVTQQEAC